MEMTDKTCKNMTIKYVSSPLECQLLCFETITCVGISYNNHSLDHCRLCKDYELTQAPDGFGFFRRPGKNLKRITGYNEICILKAIDDYNPWYYQNR